MGDLLGLIVLIIIGFVSQKNKKQKKAQKAQRAAQATAGEPIIPYDQSMPEKAAATGASMHKDAQFEREMRAIRAKAKEKLAAQRAAQAAMPSMPRETVVQTTMLPPRTEPVEHDALHTHEPTMQPRVTTDAPAPLEPLEGVDPCHDELYDQPQAQTQDAYETDERSDDEDAAQELLRGVILSEVLTRPVNRWRTQHR